MRKFYELLLIAFFVISIGLSSCHRHTVEPIVIDAITRTVEFSTEIQPVFDTKCVSCHTITQPVLVSGSAYNSLINGDFINTADPETSSLYVKLNSLQHPSSSGTFSAEELAILLAWIEQGANNN